MGKSIYLASTQENSEKSTIALGLAHIFTGSFERTAVFRPIIKSRDVKDDVLELLLSRTNVPVSYEESFGVTYDEFHANPDEAISTILYRYREIEKRADMVLVVGSDYTNVHAPVEVDDNARIAANLGAVVMVVLNAASRSPEEMLMEARIAMEEISCQHATVVGVMANRVAPEIFDSMRETLRTLPVPAWSVPAIPLMDAATVEEIRQYIGATLEYGDPELLSREVTGILIAGMNTNHVLERLKEGQLVVVPSDRPAVLLAVIAAHAADSFPSLAGIVLNGGFKVPAATDRLIRGFGQHLPIIATDHDSYQTASLASKVRGSLNITSQRKIDAAVATFEQLVESQSVLDRVDFTAPSVVTPLMFQARLLEAARAADKHIVLPEGTDDRILRAASTLLARKVARLTILGDEKTIRARAAELSLDISEATVVSPEDPKLVETFAKEYQRLRAHKGMTIERAHEIVQDVSYFGTMMVHMGMADGMVSGAAHTTAHTIKPSFEIIKTRPGVSTVSSVFLMLMADEVLVYGDCAVIPDPTVEQLADIALSSAETAENFGVDPRVAMLSYSTGSSGSGADVDKVRAATELVKERDPQLRVEGPIQYDAAVDLAVAATKIPDSDVAGRATVLIFPDLNTGNNTYKAVQRSSGAVAVGPVLQGLNKPVNDLSRGALVEDIVNTVAITAVQASV